VSASSVSLASAVYQIPLEPACNTYSSSACRGVNIWAIVVVRNLYSLSFECGIQSARKD
jgi:hypothetical protein